MKKGFTLVELLAVIVILAVILVIAVPQINSVIKQTKINGLASTAKLIAAKAEEKQVENDALGNNEALTCANLVKLDDNYGSCTVSVNNGVATVTLKGAGKFAGITCSGTKSNMTCTEGDSNSEYIYSFGSGAPYHEYIVSNPTACISYITDLADELTANDICNNSINTNAWFESNYDAGYTYTVTNFDICKSSLPQIFINSGASQEVINSNEVQSRIDNLCNNSDNVDGNGESASDTFRDLIDQFPPYENFSDFLLRSENAFDAFTTYSLENGKTEYEDLKLDNNGYVPEVFTRWPNITNNSADSTEKEVCVLYKGNINCFKYGDSYSINSSKLEALFGSNNCSTVFTTYNGINCYDENIGCTIYENGLISCGTSSTLGCPPYSFEPLAKECTISSGTANCECNYGTA